jgi:KDO2-lipid IV(A) lauroyltransferase
MKAVFYYCTYPFIYLVALLPFRVLYRLSDVLYHLLRISGYRKKIILRNLTLSFPDKNPAEIERLYKAYNRTCAI